MDHLRCQSPAMLRREILMHLIGYNLIRCLMAEAAGIHHVDLELISFKGSVDTLRQFSLVIAQARSRRQQSQLISAMLAALAADPLPHRPPPDRTAQPETAAQRLPVLNQAPG